MGGRGATSLGGGGGTGGVDATDIVSTRSLMGERSSKPTEVDETMEAFKNVYAEYRLDVADIQIAELKGKSALSALAYYDGANVAFNQSYFNKAKMDAAMERSVKSGWHPSIGNKTALEAVAAHELGHALTDKVAEKMGLSGLNKIQPASKAIMEQAAKKAKSGSRKMASKISGYAKTNHCEAIAEAFADVYCNGNKARSESKAVMSVVNSYLK